MGNYEPGLVSINDIEIETARMSITPHELYTAYYGRGDYGKDQITFILNVLNELSKKQFLVTLNLPSTSKDSKSRKINKFRTYLPLFQIGILNNDLTENESQFIDNNPLLIEGKKCLFLFKFGPIFTINIRESYIEIPEDMHLRITSAQAAGKSGRIPQCVNIMRDLLLREKQLGRNTIERDEETLIHILRLTEEHASGRKARITERLKKTFDIFTELGLIKNVTETVGSRGQKKYEIEINPEFK